MKTMEAHTRLIEQQTNQPAPTVPVETPTMPSMLMVYANSVDSDFKKFPLAHQLRVLVQLNKLMEETKTELTITHDLDF